MSARVMTPVAINEGHLSLLSIGAVAILVMVIYSSSVASIVELWGYSEYRHGALVLPISAYLLWRARDGLATAAVAPWWPGLIIVAALVLVWWLSRFLDVRVLEQAAAVMLIPAAVAAALGIGLLRRALFPLLFLIAAVPMGDGLLPYLMVITADISAALLRLTGVPVFRDGQFLALPGGNFEVADVCAGLNYLVSGLMISALFAYLTYRRNLKRILFVGAAALSLILANCVRAFIVMYVASASDMRYLAGRDHIWFGWVLFGLVVVGLFLLGARWADQEEARDPHAPPSGGGLRETLPLALVLALVLLAATAQRFQADLGSSWKLLLPVGAVLLWVLFKRFGRESKVEVDRSSRVAGYGTARSASVVGVAVLLLVAGPMLAPEGIRAAAIQTASFELPSLPLCSKGSSTPFSDLQGGTQTPDFAAVAAYDCSGEEAVSVVVAGFWGAGPGREVHLLMPTAWRNSPVARRELPSSEGRALAVNELQLPGRLVWFWYRVGDRAALSPVGAKLLLAVESVGSEQAASGLYLLETKSGASPELARRRLMAAAAVLADVALPPSPHSGLTWDHSKDE